MTIRGTTPPDPPRFLGELGGEIRRAGWVAGYQAAIDKEEQDWDNKE